ncbi:hypothetical protein [Sphingomonas sp.]|uniref:hypothetical protein n=1 Tax=Sphingomonas sp. TaxID=28214 RepID=UPI003F6E4B73
MAKHPISEAVRDGTRVFVTNGNTVARAKWTGSMWAYDTPGVVMQIDFKPTHWVDDPADILSGADV